jgi:hypothetical protein
MFMYPNAKGSEALSILATLDPASQAAGTVATGWVSVASFHAFLAIVETGGLGAAATLDAKVQQAQDNVGAGVKDVAGKAIVQIVKATGDNKQALINLKPEDVDNANGFAFVRLSLTIGVTASLVAGKLLGVNPRYAPADALNQAAVVQVI